ncbi:unnamed protein product [Owenia fusiformis]|uniref:non-specific serine/threonine protein kinase n=1 Tax=Owenia fusiformis TaxID=6347 RepID=A0A8S4NQW1_OWEFU|nr:unnamed protein product [Owenia fusiformis]
MMRRGAINYTLETRLNKLDFKNISKLCRMLDIGHKWKEFVCVVRSPYDPDTPRYTMEHVGMFEFEGNKPGRSPTQCIIEDLNTVNVTLKNLKSWLLEIKHFQAVQWLVRDVLKEPFDQESLEQPSWGSSGGPHVRLHPGPAETPVQQERYQAASNEPSQTDSSIIRSMVPPTPPHTEEVLYSSQSEQQSHPTTSASTDTIQSNSISSSSISTFSLLHEVPPDGSDNNMVGNHESKLSHFPVAMETSGNFPVEQDESTVPGSRRNFSYEKLQIMTNDFNDLPLEQKGNLIGRGGFGSVYLGRREGLEDLAVKRLTEDKAAVEKLYKTELEILLRCTHENILTLRGYSEDGPQFCLVYQYMVNGSLEDRLACKNCTPPLSLDTRVGIVTGTARGLDYLHGVQRSVHRDVKSANILLDENFQAKVGDFGFARQGPVDGKTSLKTEMVIGTNVYMAPEAWDFKISEKLDSYAFGVILLEILTGLPAFDSNREESGLPSHVEDVSDNDTTQFKEMLDPKIPEWPDEVVDLYFNISQACLQLNKRKRATINKVLLDLEKLAHNVPSLPMDGTMKQSMV